MKNNMIQANHGYGRVLYDIECSAEPLSLVNLHIVKIPGLDGVYRAWLATEHWTFIEGHLTTDVSRTAPCLGTGEGRNGVELWRGLVRTHEGGAGEVENVDTDALHTMKKIPTPKGKPLHLADREARRNKYGCIFAN